MFIAEYLSLLKPEVTLPPYNLQGGATITDFVHPVDIATTVASAEGVVGGVFLERTVGKKQFPTEDVANNLFPPSMILLSTSSETPSMPSLGPSNLTESIDVSASLDMNSTDVTMVTSTLVADESLKTITIIPTSCDCACQPVPTPVNRDDFMSSILAELELDKPKLSANRRKYRSENVDRRWPTLSMGGFGVAIIAVVFGGIILMDLRRVAQDVGLMLQNFRSALCDDEDDDGDNDVDTGRHGDGQMPDQSDRFRTYDVERRADGYYAMATDYYAEFRRFRERRQQQRRQEEEF